MTGTVATRGEPPRPPNDPVPWRPYKEAKQTRHMRLVGDHSGDLAREGLKSADHRLDKRVSQIVIGMGQIRPPKGNSTERAGTPYFGAVAAAAASRKNDEVVRFRMF